MDYNGVYMVTVPPAFPSLSTAAVLVELQVPADTQIELIRAWISPATNITDDIQEVEIYVNDAVATGGSAGQEREIQGIGDATSSVTALVGNPTQGATPTTLLADAFHLQQGWVHWPMEDERIRIAGGSVLDNIGMKLAVAPGAAITITYGMVWGELG